MLLLFEPVPMHEFLNHEEADLIEGERVPSYKFKLRTMLMENEPQLEANKQDYYVAGIFRPGVTTTQVRPRDRNSGNSFALFTWGKRHILGIPVRLRNVSY